MLCQSAVPPSSQCCRPGTDSAYDDMKMTIEASLRVARMQFRSTGGARILAVSIAPQGLWEKSMPKQEAVPTGEPWLPRKDEAKYSSGGNGGDQCANDRESKIGSKLSKKPRFCMEKPASDVVG